MGDHSIGISSIQVPKDVVWQIKNEIATYDQYSAGPKISPEAVFVQGPVRVQANNSAAYRPEEQGNRTYIYMACFRIINVPNSHISKFSISLNEKRFI